MFRHPHFYLVWGFLFQPSLVIQIRSNSLILKPIFLAEPPTSPRLRIYHSFESHNHLVIPKDFSFQV